MWTNMRFRFHSVTMDCKPVVIMSVMLISFWFMLSYLTNSYFIIFLIFSNFILLFACCVSLSGYVVKRYIDTRQESSNGLVEVSTVGGNSQSYLLPDILPPSYEEAIRSPPVSLPCQSMDGVHVICSAQQEFLKERMKEYQQNVQQQEPHGEGYQGSPEEEVLQVQRTLQGVNEGNSREEGTSDESGSSKDENTEQQESEVVVTDEIHQAVDEGVNCQVKDNENNCMNDSLTPPSKLKKDKRTRRRKGTVKDPEGQLSIEEENMSNGGTSSQINDDTCAVVCVNQEVKTAKNSESDVDGQQSIEVDNLSNSSVSLKMNSSDLLTNTISCPVNQKENIEEIV